MLEVLEQLMTIVRRIKLYVTLGSATASALAIALVEMTRNLMYELERAGNDFTHRIFENEFIGIIVLCGIGLGVLSAYFRHDGEPKLAEIPIYLIVGLVGIAGLFWLGPQVAHFIASELLSPAFRLLADFLSGEATVSIKLFLKVLFLIYLVSFAIDVLFQRYVKGQDVAEAVEVMGRKYWKELLEVGHDIFDVALALPRLLIRITRRDANGSD